MAEGEEAGFAVVGAHAALTHTAKAHGAGGQMDDGVVDAAAAIAAAGCDGINAFAVFGEEIEGQRLGLIGENGIDAGGGHRYVLPW